MSRKAYILTKEDVPQYIRAIVQRLQPVLMEYSDEDGDWWGYTFRLNAKWKCGYEPQLVNDCEKLLKWCNSWYAHAKLIKYMWWYDEVNTTQIKGSYQHQRMALKKGWKNHAYLVISDPVAYRFEKDNFYRENNKMK